jgi:SAM-dependent methyltransferase
MLTSGTAATPRPGSRTKHGREPMNLRSVVPGLLKPAVRALLKPLRRTSHRLKTREELHAYWQDPDEGNRPEAYLEHGAPTKRSEFLVRLFRQYVSPEWRILEIGCNAGRNLHFLDQAGYHNLAGIEISPQAVRLLHETFPEMARRISIYRGAVEAVIRELNAASFDVVFALAVLEHIHPESDWIFSEMARIAGRLLVTIEDERSSSWRHVPRSYDQVFEPLGMKQVCMEENGPEQGLSPVFVTRVFQKP